MKRENKIWKYAGGMLAFFLIMAVVILYFKIEITEAELPETEYEWSLKRLESLERVARDYDTENGEELVYVYIRCKRYNALSWRMMAGTLSKRFENYVSEHQHWGVEELQSVEVLELPNGEDCDFVHLFAVMNMIEKGAPVVGGWGGDLVQLASFIKETTGDFDVLLAKAKEKLGAEDSLYNELDIFADMDAVNLHSRKQKQEEYIWKIFDNYYREITPKQRVQEFLKNEFFENDFLESESGEKKAGNEEILSNEKFEDIFDDTENFRAELRERIYQTFVKDVWVNALFINYEIDGEKYKEHKRAAAYALADYCCDACVNE